MNIDKNNWFIREDSLTEKQYVEVCKYLVENYIYDAVYKHFEENYKDSGWVIQSDGAQSQQRTSGIHKYSIKRYEDVENPLECERGY